ncbi:MAG: hypothetical protein ACO2ZP_12025, partial [Bacteriovoracaceae bacterium]
MLIKWSLVFSFILFCSCSIPSARKEVKKSVIAQEEPNLEQEIDDMLDSPEKKLERLKSKKKDYT